MLSRFLITALVLLLRVRLGKAELLSDITVLEEGYNVILGLECFGCPFFFKYALKEDGPWEENDYETVLVSTMSDVCLLCCF